MYVSHQIDANLYDMSFSVYRVTYVQIHCFIYDFFCLTKINAQELIEFLYFNLYKCIFNYAKGNAMAQILFSCHN